ncbi:MAG TPA: Ig-like domain-containing protein [Streptosporangiaceae bacterium]|nr:Ig-like domain-containing protein [Streptosporangiaceae bacterium]
MRLRTKLGASLVAVAVAGIAIGMSGAAGATTAAPDGTWGPVQEIPGLAALTQTSGWHNPSNVRAVGCSTLGNCVAVGDYGSPATGATVLFVAAEVNGTWGNAQPLAGLPAVALDTAPTLTNVSCGTPDFCTAVGTYYDTDNIPHVFAVTETGGTWGTPTVLAASGLGIVQSFGFSGLSCPAAGECTLVGAYTLTGATPVPFTADESAGSWGALQPLADLASLDQPSPLAVTGGLTSLSCGAPGDCTAGGSYQYGTVQQPFIVSESSHTWGEPEPIPGIAEVSSSGQGNNGRGNQVTSVSCPDASDCAVVGTFFPELNSPGLFFTLDEGGGAWGQAKALSIPSADSGNAASTAFVSCRSAGNCVIAATAANDSAAASSEVVTATESSSGAWGAATAIPGVSAADEPFATGLDCVPAGDCTVLGVRFPGGMDPNEIFTATSMDGGAMGAAQQVASSGDVGPLHVNLACPQNGHCTVTYNGLNATVGVVGTYSGITAPQMVTEATPATVTLTASGPKMIYGAEQSAPLTATVSSPDGGAPTGTVTVTGAGGGTLCTIVISSGTGSCSLTATQLPVGTSTLTAAYGGDATYLPASGTSTVTVAQAATVTHLAFTPRNITFTGAATRLAVTGSVSSTAGTPNGRVTVRVDGTAVSGCTKVPFTGTVSCKGTTAILAGGKHLVTLAYSGGGDFAASTSVPLPLTVAKRGTTTTLALAKGRVTYRHESAEKLTASVSRAGRVYPTGKVAVRIGGTTICRISLNKGTGSCRLANTRLRAGKYKVVALYSGDVNYHRSDSGKKTLKVGA